MIACVFRHGGPFDNLPVLADQFADAYEQPDDATTQIQLASRTAKWSGKPRRGETARLPAQAG